MNKKFSNIKSRIVHFVEYQGLPKGEFFDDIGLTPQNFRGRALNTAVNSDAIAKILLKFPDLNPYWLILGKGEMLISDKKMVAEVAALYGSPNLEEEVRNLKAWLRDKEKLISHLEDKLAMYERMGEKQPKAGGAR